MTHHRKHGRCKERVAQERIKSYTPKHMYFNVKNGNVMTLEYFNVKNNAV
jgi:hypothetical protein